MQRRSFGQAPTDLLAQSVQADWSDLPRIFGLFESPAGSSLECGRRYGQELVHSPIVEMSMRRAVSKQMIAPLITIAKAPRTTSSRQRVPEV